MKTKFVFLTKNQKFDLEFTIDFDTFLRKGDKIDVLSFAEFYPKIFNHHKSVTKNEIYDLCEKFDDLIVEYIVLVADENNLYHQIAFLSEIPIISLQMDAVPKYDENDNPTGEFGDVRLELPIDTFHTIPRVGDLINMDQFLYDSHECHVELAKVDYVLFNKRDITIYCVEYF